MVEGTFVYRAKQGRSELDHDLVESFVKERLGGRISPIALFLSEAMGLDPEEMKKLKELIENLEP